MSVMVKNVPSSRNVNRPICGKSLNASRQIIPPSISRRTIATWSCLIKRGRTVLFSFVFLSIRHSSALAQQQQQP